MTRRAWNGMCCVLVAGGLLAGCSTDPARRGEQKPALIVEANQGMLGDLNRYIHALLRQRSAGNAEAEKVLIRLLAGKGLPASEKAVTGQ